ncbi:type II toxin-antitoxin system RelE/ParE family toxin [bacterium]|nr:type II toxin-antitoxin system RelE/ParE family toxin [bacterium]
MQHKKIKIFKTPAGKEPFLTWFRSLKDLSVRTRIRTRLDRVALGNLRDYKALGEGVFELKFNFGVRIYFGQIGNIVVLLLHGGDKKTQQKDIKKAKDYWRWFHE